jgi:uncharacterized membrane protein
MKRLLLLFLPAIFTASCNLNTTPENNNSLKLDSLKIGRDTSASVKEYKGLYSKHYSHFINCSDGKIFVLKNNALPDSLYDSILSDPYSGQSIAIQMNAITDPGDPNAILFTGNLKAEQKNHKNTCIPFEYWCMGMEPFWTIQISKNEDLIDLYEPMEQRTTHFAYAAPDIKNGVATYSASDGQNKISIIIKKEKCNGAIDRQYDYSAEIQFNSKKLNGCAIKYAENI